MTDKKYAHEIVPHPDEGETKPLEYLVRYHYAQAMAWHLTFAEHINNPGPLLDIPLSQFLGHIQLAFLHDALAQGLVGQEAADWASSRTHGESAEWIYERSEVYGLDCDQIRAYRLRETEVA